MQVIVTTFLPATNTKPARIRAKTSNYARDIPETRHHRTVLSVSDAPSIERAHQWAADKLRIKLNWRDKAMVCGTLDARSLVWVFTKPHDPHVCTLPAIGTAWDAFANAIEEGKP